MTAEYVSWVGVVGLCGFSVVWSFEREDDAVGDGKGEGVDIAQVGSVERLPDVVKGVKSRTSGKCTRMVFFAAYWP